MDELKKQIQDSLKRDFDYHLNDRVERAANLEYTKIVGSHYFAPASWECLQLYRDGYYLGTIMGTQALIEALIKFVAERSRRNKKGDLEEIIRDLKNNQSLSEKAADAALKVWRHRNDFHHLNANIQNHDLEAKAKECIDGLCLLENELFGGKIEKGVLIPTNPKFYDIGSDGTTPVFLRQFNA